MTNTTAKLTAAVAIALLALPAAAGSWPNITPRKAQLEEKKAAETPRVASATPAADVTAPYVNGFEFVGGETGWQPAGHKYVWSAGRFAHSEECDHAIRVVSGPTPAEVEAARIRSPGA